MCRGDSGEAHHEMRHNNKDDGAADDHAKRRSTVRCELCDSRASLYCQADDAYLCRKCDKSVHGANFLAHRHVRCMLCNTCQNLTRRYLVGAHREMLLPSAVCGDRSIGRVTRHERQHDDDYCSSSEDGADEQQKARPLKRPFLFL